MSSFFLGHEDLLQQASGDDRVSYISMNPLDFRLKRLRQSGKQSKSLEAKDTSRSSQQGYSEGCDSKLPMNRLEVRLVVYDLGS